jgi:hypothetical protein
MRGLPIGKLCSCIVVLAQLTPVDIEWVKQHARSSKR